MLERETPLPVDVMVAESLISINKPACHAIFFLLCYFVHGHLSFKKTKRFYDTNVKSSRLNLVPPIFVGTSFRQKKSYGLGRNSQHYITSEFSEISC